MLRRFLPRATFWLAAGLALGIRPAAWPEPPSPIAIRAGAARVDICSSGAAGDQNPILISAEVNPSHLQPGHAEEAVVNGLLELVRGENGEQYAVRENVEYSHDPVPLKLDAHIPPGEGPFPAVILVHGGGWTTGDKTADFIRPLFPVLDRSGLAWFTIDYRLAPQHLYPAAEEDVERAIAFVKQHAAEFKVDPKKIALMGESAGAHLVDVVGARNRPPADVAAVVSFYGPIDLIKLLDVRPGAPGAAAGALKTVFGITEVDERALARLRAASPTTWISSRTPPFLIIHGTKDPIVPYDQATLAVTLFKKAGVPCDLIPVEGGVHGVINWEKEPRFQNYKTPMIEWLRAHLR